MYQEQIIHHYEMNWKRNSKIYLWDKGPIEKLSIDFRVIEFEPNNERNLWTYATCCMSNIELRDPIEIHIFSETKDLSLVELLTTVAYYHHTSMQLNLHHSVNFGKPWQGDSQCQYGLISLPYLDGPSLENLKIKNGKILKFYWLIPITLNELNFKIKFNIELLEKKFEESEFEYANPNRKSLV